MDFVRIKLFAISEKKHYNFTIQNQISIPNKPKWYNNLILYNNG